MCCFTWQVLDSYAYCGLETLQNWIITATKRNTSKWWSRAYLCFSSSWNGDLSSQSNQNEVHEYAIVNHEPFWAILIGFNTGREVEWNKEARKVDLEEQGTLIEFEWRFLERMPCVLSGYVWIFCTITVSMKLSCNLRICGVQSETTVGSSKMAAVRNYCRISGLQLETATAGLRGNCSFVCNVEGTFSA